MEIHIFLIAIEIIVAAHRLVLGVVEGIRCHVPIGFPAHEVDGLRGSRGLGSADEMGMIGRQFGLIVNVKPLGLVEDRHEVIFGSEGPRIHPTFIEEEHVTVTLGRVGGIRLAGGRLFGS